MMGTTTLFEELQDGHFLTCRFHQIDNGIAGLDESDTNQPPSQSGWYIVLYDQAHRSG
jgi:hypothetical protein